MRSPRVQKTVTSPLFVKPQLTTASTPKTTPRKVKKHPQPVTLNLGRMMKFDARNRKSSATVSQILEKKSEYSTPAGVKQFLYNHTVEKTQYHSAVIIQRTWKRYKALQRLFRFLNFAHRMVQKQHRFIFYTWYIRMTPPANIATRVYNHLVSFLKTENFSIDNRLKLASFDEFMKTNHLCLRKDLDVSKIYKFIRIMNKSTMRKIFLCWSDYAVDQVTIKKGSVKANLLWKSRVRFGFEYVAFHFWRNWSFFKKHNRFNPTIEAHMYIPEWTFFRSTIETKIRMKKQADYQRKITLLSNSFHSIRENSLYETKLAQRYQNCIKIFMRSTMNKAVRALANNVIFTKLNQGIKKRVIKAWYHTIDVEIIKKTAAGAYKKRVELKILNKVFHGWNNFSTREMIRIVKLITSARENEVKFLKIIYPLVNDFPHFFAIQAYAKWKHLIHMEKRANKFVYWTFNLARTREFYKFILDVFRENIGHPMNYYDFWHYRFDGDKNFYAHHKKTSGKNSRSAHFWKQIHKLLAKKEEISLVYPPPSISTTINAIKHVENFPSYGEWATTATSDQVRTLFYRIILAVTNKNLLYIRKPQEKITKRLDKSLDDFQKENKLMTYSQICEFRNQLEIQSVERRLLRKFRNRRDHDQLMSLEAHNAAHVFQTSWPVNFSLNEEPKTIRTEEELPIKPSDLPKPKNTYLTTPRKSEPHPFLQPISLIKNQIIENNRKFLRKPEEVFMQQQKAQLTIVTAQIPNRKKATKPCEHRFGYENHVPIVQNPDITNMLVDRDFIITELQNLQIAAQKEKIKRMRTEDLQVLTQKSKPKTRNKTIDPNLAQEIRRESNPNHIFEVSTEREEEQQEEVEPEPLIKGIMLARVSATYLKNGNYFYFTQRQRIETLVKRFLEFLNFILCGSTSAYEFCNMDQLHKRLFYIIHRIVPPKEIKKLSKRSKSPRVSKSKVGASPKKKAKAKKSKKGNRPQKPKLPEIFELKSPSVNEKMIIKFFGKLIMNDLTDLLPFPQFLCPEILFQHVSIFLFIDGNIPEVVSHLQRMIIWFPSSEKEINDLLTNFQKVKNYIPPPPKKEEPKPEIKVPASPTRSRSKRKTLLPDQKLDADDAPKSPIPIAKRRKSITIDFPLIQKKFMLETDFIGAAICLSQFLAPYVAIFYPNINEVNSYDGFDELHTTIKELIESTDEHVIVPEDGDAPKQPTPEELSPVVEETKSSRNRRQSFAPNVLMTEVEKAKISRPVRSRRQRVSWAKSVEATIKKVSDEDIELFLSLSPYAIPSSLLNEMIKSEREKAKTIQTKT